MSTSTSGRSILEMLWHEMDHQYGKLQGLAGYGDQDAIKSAQRGHCLGIAKCIAIMTNPYDPDVDAVRAETKRRYEQA